MATEQRRRRQRKESRVESAQATAAAAAAADLRKWRIQFVLDCTSTHRTALTNALTYKHSITQTRGHWPFACKHACVRACVRVDALVGITLVRVARAQFPVAATHAHTLATNKLARLFTHTCLGLWAECNYCAAGAQQPASDRPRV